MTSTGCLGGTFVENGAHEIFMFRSGDDVGGIRLGTSNLAWCVGTE